MKKNLLIIFSLIFCITTVAQTIVHIDDPNTWKATSLNAYLGQTIKFDYPMVICNNGGWSGKGLTISPHRIYAATNQEIPGTSAYNDFKSNHSVGTMTLNGADANPIHRTGTRIKDLVVTVSSASATTLNFVSGTFVGNKRTDMEKMAEDRFPDLGDYDLLVCAMNCEYYLVEDFGTGYGPNTAAEHEKQKSKVIGALAAIDADLYGLIEVQQGVYSLREIAQELHNRLGHDYDYQNTTETGGGSYTGAGMIWRKDRLEPLGGRVINNTGVKHRKQMQGFRDLKSGETFIYSINHFKAKGSGGQGKDADQGDGQGAYNATRTAEAKAIYSDYNTLSRQLSETDILIMGDLNAYAKEDPIRAFTNAGLIDLHRAFHTDTSYSYTFSGAAGYLDHAIASRTMRTQVTGMMGYHINSDENDCYTYDSSNDLTRFRCSDHDPILVGIRLDHEAAQNISQTIYITEYVRVFDLYGHLMYDGNYEDMRLNLPKGVYLFYRYCEVKDLENNPKGQEVQPQIILIP